MPELHEFLAIELRSDDELLSELRELGPENEVTRKGFDGSDVVIVLVTLATTTIAQTASIIKKAIDARKHISVKYKGVEIKGVSEKRLLELLSTARQNKDG
jgi:hypothetical protein